MFHSLRRLQFIRNSPRKVFFCRFKARIFIFGIDRRGITEYRVTELFDYGVVVFFREFFDIRNIYRAALVLTDLQRLETVVRTRYRRIRSDRAFREHVRFRYRFFVVRYVLARKQQCTVAVGLEQSQIVLTVDISESFDETIVFRAELPLLF